MGNIFGWWEYEGVRLCVGGCFLTENKLKKVSYKVENSQILTHTPNNISSHLYEMGEKANRMHQFVLTYAA